jgi:hypothetical protein
MRLRGQKDGLDCRWLRDMPSLSRPRAVVAPRRLSPRQASQRRFRSITLRNISANQKSTIARAIRPTIAVVTVSQSSIGQ